MNYSVENPCSQTDFGLWDSLIQTQIMTPSQSACLLSTGGEGMQMRKQFPGWIIRHSSCERKKKNLKVAKLWESPKWHIQHSPHKSQSASCPVITLLLCPVALTLYCYPSSPSTWLYHSSGQALHVTLLTALWLSLFCRGSQPICMIQTMALVLCSPSHYHCPPLPSFPWTGKVHVIYLSV